MTATSWPPPSSSLTRTERPGGVPRRSGGQPQARSRGVRALRTARPFGVACAGTVDSERGVVIASPNLPLEDVPWPPCCRRRWASPLVLENDVNAAVWAEATVGVAAGLRHVVMLTLGTGVGGGLWLDGRVYRGANGGAAELGHTIVRAGGLPCPCGSHGCLEVYASGRALVRYAAARAGDKSTDPSGELTALQEQGRLTGGAVTRLALAGRQRPLSRQ